jgi:hypothetical protein
MSNWPITHQRTKSGNETACGQLCTVENREGSTFFGQRVTCPACIAIKAPRKPKPHCNHVSDGMFPGICANCGLRIRDGR